MKLTVKTLKGTHFPITVQPDDTIMAVKKNIEEVQGRDSYPSGQQLLIHSGKVLNDESTLAENNISENGFLVIMLSKSKTSGSSGSTSSQTVLNAAAASNVSSAAKDLPPQPAAPIISGRDSPSAVEENLGAETGLELAPEEQSILQLLDMGGGRWDREEVQLALTYANNNPELAVDYLYTGIPDNREVAERSEPTLVPLPTSPAAHVAPASGAPNSLPLNLFPQEAVSGAAGAGGGSLEFLRNNPQFETLRSLVQGNPQILQPLLQELGKQNPNIIRLIQENNQEFLQLLNEPVDGSEGDIFDQVEEDMPHAVNVTPAEQEAIERMEAMGFDRALVLEAFLACDRNEELAINYLLENAGDFMD